MTPTKRAATAVYNPHLLDREDLIASFVARRGLLEELLDDLRRGGGQHHLLVGARGAGKTTFLLRLAYGVQDDRKLSRKCLPLRFPEEQYNVARPSDFWMNCLDALTDALEKKGDRKGAAEIDDAVERLEALDEQERGSQSLELLTRWAKRAKTLLVLLVDNLDLVLDRLRETHWLLREVLSADNRLVLIGASSTFIQDTFVYESPFYDFFNVHELGGLSEVEARDVLLQLSRSTGASQVEQILTSDPGRFKALYVLTGGTPRTIALLHGVLAAGKTARVEDDLEGLLDQLTPYYKARFDDLPPQSQVIVDAVALHWHPITAGECAQSARLDVNLVSAQLARLARQGVVGKVSLPDGRKLGFQLTERFFNIWYLMRASRRLRRRLAWLVEFLRTFYGEAEVQRRAEELLSTPEGREAAAGGASKMFAYASAVEDHALRARLEFRAIQCLVREGSPGDKLRELLDLDGEDAHLGPVIDRVQAIRKLKAGILAAKIRWPKDMPGTQFVEAFASHPGLSLHLKLEALDHAKTHPELLARVANDFHSLRRLAEDFGPALVVAVGRGQVPCLPDVATAEEVDAITALAQDQRRVMIALGLIWESTWERPTAAHLLRKILSFPAPVAIPLFAMADIKVKERDWPEARSRVLRLWKLSEQEKLVFVSFFVSCAHYGFAKEAADLLQEAELDEKHLPLYEALRAFSAGPHASLAHLAPEVRTPAEEILKSMLAAPSSSSSVSSPAAPPSPKKAARRRK